MPIYKRSSFYPNESVDFFFSNTVHLREGLYLPEIKHSSAGETASSLKRLSKLRRWPTEIPQFWQSTYPSLTYLITRLSFTQVRDTDHDSNFSCSRKRVPLYWRRRRNDVEYTYLRLMFGGA